MSLLARLRRLWWLSGQTFEGDKITPKLKNRRAVIVEKNDALNDFPL